jgi:hypothetical protein
MTAACISEPISWLRLEQFALGRKDAAVTEHVATCAACRQCLDEIRSDLVALPPLPVAPARKRAPRWWVWAVPALAAAAIAIVVLRPRPRPPENIAGVKGVGDVVLGTVRERDGVVQDDLTTFGPSDRWKVVVTCPPDKGAWIDVAVVEDRMPTADYPLAPAHVACGNRVVVPGAFTLTGTRPNHVCVRIAADAAPPRDVPHVGDPDVACVTIRPE